MKTLKYVSLMIIAFVFILGCAGNYGTLKYQSKSESKATKQELVDNWSKYNIWLISLTEHQPPRPVAITFHTKNDHRELILKGIGSKVKVTDQEMWTNVLKENTTKEGELALVKGGSGRSSTKVVEIRGPDNQLHGFMVYQEWAVEVERVALVDDNTLQLWYKRYVSGGGR